MENTGDSDDIYEQIEEAGLPPIRKQKLLTGKTFLIHDIERKESEFEDGGDYYIADVSVNGTRAKYYLAGLAILPKLAVLEQRRDRLPISLTQISRKVRGGAMYDLVRPETGDLESVDNAQEQGRRDPEEE